MQVKQAELTLARVVLAYLFKKVLPGLKFGSFQQLMIMMHFK
jgi:hypothetical protein